MYQMIKKLLNVGAKHLGQNFYHLNPLLPIYISYIYAVLKRVLR